VLKRGAEAVISSVEWRGRPAVEKLRVPKGYRDPRLDDELRRARIRKEAKLFAEARAAGVPVPVLYDVDLAGHRLVMERIDGPTLKEVLRSPGDHGSLCEEIGRLVAKLHSSGLVHGDLTTSNMLLAGGRVHLIDFSLGEKTDGRRDHRRGGRRRCRGCGGWRLFSSDDHVAAEECQRTHDDRRHQPRALASPARGSRLVLLTSAPARGGLEWGREQVAKWIVSQGPTLQCSCRWVDRVLSSKCLTPEGAAGRGRLGLPGSMPLPKEDAAWRSTIPVLRRSPSRDRDR